MTWKLVISVIFLHGCPQRKRVGSQRKVKGIQAAVIVKEKAQKYYTHQTIENVPRRQDSTHGRLQLLSM